MQALFGSVIVVVCVVLGGGFGFADDSIANIPRSEVADEAFHNVNGEPFRLPKPGEVAATVVIFVGHDCPISNSYSPEIARIVKEFAAKKIAFCLVYADADLETEQAKKHAAEYGIPCPAILDPKLTLARRFGATIKPEVAVLSATGDRVYLGRIDDRYVDFGKRREQPTRRELREVLAAIVEGKPIPHSRVKAIGCDIDFPKVRPRAF